MLVPFGRLKTRMRKVAAAPRVETQLRRSSRSRRYTATLSSLATVLAFHGPGAPAYAQPLPGATYISPISPIPVPSSPAVSVQFTISADGKRIVDSIASVEFQNPADRLCLQAFGFNGTEILQDDTFSSTASVFGDFTSITGTFPAAGRAEGTMRAVSSRCGDSGTLTWTATVP